MNLDLFSEHAAPRNICDLSPCGIYRYRLTRHLGGFGPPLVYIMLNPSDADMSQDDPTWTRCLGFGRSFDRERVVAVNLYPYRTPYPEKLRNAWKQGVDIIGPRGDQPLDNLDGHVVCAWGPPKWSFIRDRIRDVVVLLKRRGHILYCLGTSKDGSPRHPLMLRADSQLQLWEAP